jgi:hypothetical protein
MKKKLKESKLSLEKFTVAELNNSSAMQIKGGTANNGGGNETLKPKDPVVVIIIFK